MRGDRTSRTGNSGSRLASLLHECLAVTLAVLIFFTALTLIDTNSPIGMAVVGENATFGYFGPQTVVFWNVVTMDLSAYFNETGLTYVATDSPGATVSVDGSTLTLESNQTLSSYDITVVGSRADEFLSVPLTFVDDVTQPLTEVAYPFADATFRFWDENGLDVETILVQPTTRTIVYGYTPALNPSARSEVTLNTAVPVDASPLARVGDMAGRTTTVFGLEDVLVNSATLTLAKNGVVDYIYRCADFDAGSFTCPEWKATPIPFTDNGTHVTFTVDSFSAYAGGEDPKEYVFSCGALQTAGASLSLYEDITADETCLSIAASGVTLDCQGNTITTSQGHAITVEGANSVTLINCSTAATNGTGLFVDQTTGLSVVGGSYDGVQGLVVEDSASASISGATVDGESTSAVLRRATSPSLSSVTFAGPHSLDVRDTTDANLVSPTFTDMTMPWTVQGSPGTSVTDLVLTHDRTTVAFDGTLAFPELTTLTHPSFGVGHNSVYINTNEIPYLNTSATITFNDVEYLSPRIGVIDDFLGGWEDCEEPRCHIVSNDAVGKKLVFTVEHFSGYSSAGLTGSFKLLSVIGSPSPVTINCGASQTTNNNFYDLFSGVYDLFFSCGGGIIASDKGGYLFVKGGGQGGSHSCTVSSCSGGSCDTVKVPVTENGCDKKAIISSGSGGSGSSTLQQKTAYRMGNFHMDKPPHDPAMMGGASAWPTVVTIFELPFSPVPWYPHILLTPDQTLVPPGSPPTFFDPGIPTFDLTTIPGLTITPGQPPSIPPPYDPTVPPGIPPLTPPDQPSLTPPDDPTLTPPDQPSLTPPDDPFSTPQASSVPPGFYYGNPDYPAYLGGPTRERGRPKTTSTPGPGPGGAVPPPPPPPQPRCGDGIINQPAEQCDGNQKAACAAHESCGAPGSAAPCKCYGWKCGDGNIDFANGEQCERNADCAAAFGPGFVCAGCKCITSVPYCGDGVLDFSSEECEADIHCENNPKYGPGSKCSPVGSKQACKCYPAGGAGLPPGVTSLDYVPPPINEDTDIPIYAVPYIPRGHGVDPVHPGNKPDPTPNGLIVPGQEPPEYIEGVPYVPHRVEELAMPELYPQLASPPNTVLPMPDIQSVTPSEIESPSIVLPDKMQTTLNLPPDVVPTIFTPTDVSTPTVNLAPQSGVACGYLYEEANGPLGVQTASIPAGIPEGQVILNRPLQLTCGGEKLDLTVSIPKTFKDVTALRCKNGQCTPLTAQNTEGNLYCGAATLDQQIHNIMSPYRMYTYESGLIDINYLDINDRYPRFDAPNYAFIFDPVLAPFQVMAKNPTVLPPPKNPLLGFASVPVTLGFNNIPGEPFSMEIHSRFMPTARYDPNSYQVALIENGEYIPIDTKVDHQTRSVSAVLDDVHEWIDDANTATFVVLATLCDACQDFMFEKLHNGRTRDAIVLVHGFSSSALTWEPLVEHLRATNEPRQIYVYSYPSDKPFDTIAYQLAESLELNKDQWDTLTVVGHSLGGIVSQKALRDAADTGMSFIDNVNKAVIIGSPNDGSPIANIYTDLLDFFTNSKSFARPLPGKADVMSTLVFGEDITPVGGITYEVIAGTDTLPFLSRFFDEDNDGLVDVPGAQHLGNTFVNNKCSNYYELELDHSALIDHPLGNRVISSRITEATGGAGNNHYVQLELDRCDPTETIVLVGTPVEAGAEKDDLLCNCGNGVCGEGEDETSCPSDCALPVEPVVEEPKETAWESIRDSILLALVILVAIGLIVAIWVSHGKKTQKILPPVKPAKGSAASSKPAKKGEVKAVVPPLVEPKPQPKQPTPAKPAEPAKKTDAERSLLARLYRVPPRKEEDKEALRRLDEEVSNEAKNRLKGKKK